MQLNKRTPSEGLKILENLYKKFPNSQWIRNNIVNSYIKFGYHDKAITIIETLSNNKTDINTLQYKAWLAYQQNNIDKEKYLWKDILKKQFKAEISAPIHAFIKRSQQTINIDVQDIPLICVEHNEMSRLPYFLKYYRKLGITQFFFVDNNSNDGSLEFLLEQPDCHVFWTNDSYNEAGSGNRFVHHILDTYIPHNQWCIHADADEFLVYPQCETQHLKKFIQYLEKNGDEAVSSFMLDIYPKDIKTQLSINPEDDLITKCEYFYNNYQFLHKIDAPYIYPVGGIFGYFGITLFSITKTSLFKNNKDFRFLAATHNTTPVKISPVTSCYLHTKFIGDFYAFSKKVISEKEHAAGGQQYNNYIRMYNVLNDKNFSFASLDRSTKYQNSQQLVELGLIKTTKEWDCYE